MTWVIWVILAIIVVLVIWTIAAYNRLVRQRNVVQESWRQVDVELTRRHDLIPNLVETVKGYAAHERGTFEAVTAARAAASAPGQTPAQAAANENLLTGALRQLFAVAEAYPDLKANQNFLSLQSSLSETEDRIAASRRFYNANVRTFNTSIQSFPTNLIAGTFHFTEAEYFEAEDEQVRAAPTVSFTPTAAPAPDAAAPAVPPAAPPTPPSVPPAPPAAPPPTQ